VSPDYYLNKFIIYYINLLFIWIFMIAVYTLALQCYFLIDLVIAINKPRSNWKDICPGKKGNSKFKLWLR